MTMSKQKISDRAVAGFSKRFNGLLDRVGFPPVGAGRAKSLASRFGGSKSGAQNWIGKDLPPKRETLHLIVAELLEQIQGRYETSQVVAWLEHGQAVRNPFAPQSSVDIFNLSISSKHALLSRIYISVHKISRDMGIDIYSMEDEVIDHVYTSAIRKAVETGSNTPDIHLIASLLELAAKAPLAAAGVSKAKVTEQTPADSLANESDWQEQALSGAVLENA